MTRAEISRARTLDALIALARRDKKLYPEFFARKVTEARNRRIKQEPK